MRQLSWITPKKISLLLFAGVCLYGAICYVPQSDETVSPPLHSDTLSTKPAMPQGYQVQSPLRDPFTSDDVSVISSNRSSNQPTALPAAAGRQQQKKLVPAKKTTDAVVPALQGIVSGTKTRMAIIDYQGRSRSYALYDRIGDWAVLAIEEDYVILEGADGQTTLRLGR